MDVGVVCCVGEEVEGEYGGCGCLGGEFGEVEEFG